MATIQHTLKTLPPWYDDVAAGRKMFELRRDDRDFQIGDLLQLVEQDPKTGGLTGRRTEKRVSYVLRGRSAELFGLNEGHCILGLESA